MTDDELGQAFAVSALPADAWTHREHLRVAWLHLRAFEVDEAHLRMRVGIIRLNASHGLVETAERGYHETLTRFWLNLVRSLVTPVPAASSDAFLEMHAERLTRDAPLRYYTRDRIMSLRARAAFVEPDLLPLP